MVGSDFEGGGKTITVIHQSRKTQRRYMVSLVISVATRPSGGTQHTSGGRCGEARCNYKYNRAIESSTYGMIVDAAEGLARHIPLRSQNRHVHAWCFNTLVVQARPRRELLVVWMTHLTQHRRTRFRGNRSGSVGRGIAFFSNLVHVLVLNNQTESSPYLGGACIRRRTIVRRSPLVHVFVGRKEYLG